MFNIKVNINKKFLVLVGISFILAFISGGDLPYTIFYVFVSMLVVGGIQMIIMYKGVDVNIILPIKNINVREKMSFTINVENGTSFVLMNMFIIPEVINENNPSFEVKPVTVLPGEILRINEKCCFQKRGIYNLGKIRIEMRDVFRIIRINKEIILTREVKVYPMIVPINEFNMIGSYGNNEAFKSFYGIEDCSSIKEVRKYVIGDSLNRIHWKVSAKHNQLFVKQFENIEGLEFNLFINMNEKIRGKKGEEKYIDFIVSIIQYLLDKNIEVNIFINNSEYTVKKITNSYGFDEFIEYLVRFECDGEEGFGKFLTRNYKSISYGGIIAILDMDMDFDTRNAVINLKDLNFNLIVFNQDEEIEDTNIKALSKMGVDCYEIDSLLFVKEGEKNEN